MGVEGSWESLGESPGSPGSLWVWDLAGNAAYSLPILLVWSGVVARRGTEHNLNKAHIQHAHARAHTHIFSKQATTGRGRDGLVRSLETCIRSSLLATK